jgi:hypothetical protein
MFIAKGSFVQAYPGTHRPSLQNFVTGLRHKPLYQAFITNHLNLFKKTFPSEKQTYK